MAICGWQRLISELIKVFEERPCFYNNSKVKELISYPFSGPNDSISMISPPFPSVIAGRIELIEWNLC